MLSLSTRKLIKFFINFPSSLGIINYRVIYSQNQYKVIYLTNSKFRFVQYCDAISQVTFISYIYYRLFEQVFYLNIHLSTNLKLSLTLKWIYYAVAYGFLLVYRSHQYFYKEQLSRIFECYLNFFNVHIFESKKKVNKTPREHKKSLCILLVSVLLITIQNVIISLRRPWEKHLWTALLENPAEAPLKHKLPLLGAYVYFMCSTLGWVFHTLVCFIHGYLTCCTFKLNELERRIGMQNSSRYIQCTVRAMQILHANWEKCFKNDLLPGFMFAYTSLVVLGFYGIVKLNGSGAIKMGLVGFGCALYLMVLFGTGGRLEENSTQFLRKWSNECKMRIHSKENGNGSCKGEIKVIRSIMGLRVNVGNAFFVERSTVMKIANVLISTTVTLILV